MIVLCAIVLLTVFAAVPLTGTPVFAQNAPPGIGFDGTARTGDDTRPVRFRFSCSANAGPNVTGVLSVALDVPNYEQLRALFDFDPFEGPDADAEPRTVLETMGVHGSSADRFPAAGSVVPFGAAEAFALEVAASRRDPGPLSRLAAVLRPLIGGAARLIWWQRGPKPGGARLRADLDLTASQSEQLRTALGLCVAVHQ